MGPGKQTSCQFIFLCAVGKGAVTGDAFQPPLPGAGGDRIQRAQKAASAPLRPSAPNLPRQLPQLLLPPGLPGGATARHLD